MYQNNNSHSVPLEKKEFIQVSRKIQSCWGEVGQTFFLISDLFKSNCCIILWLSIRHLFATLYHFSVLIEAQLLSRSYHILLWEIKTIIMKRFYVSYLWILKRKKLVYFIKLLVASWKTPPTFHAVFLPRPLNVDTVSQPEIAYQNGNALHISSLNTLDIHVLVATFFADQCRIPSKVH